ncbi:NACHT domain-containing protein [Bradyrhizobium sp. USDA 3650]
MPNEDHPSTSFLTSLIESHELEMDSRFYVPARLRVDRASADAINYLLGWARDQDSPPLLLLGEYGSGKSYICRRLAYELAKARLSDAKSPVPLLFSLSELKAYGGLHGYFRARLAEAGLLARDGDWREVIDREDRVIILDEIDEVPSLRGVGDLDRVFQTIGDLSLRHPRLVLAGRSNMFARLDKVWGAPSVDRKSDSGLITPFFQITELLEFTPAQQLRYLKRRFGPDAAKLKGDIERTYGLAELAARPLLLGMIGETLRRSRKGRIPLGALYSEYAAGLLKRREQQVSIPSAELHRSCRLLAIELFKKQDAWIASEDMVAFSRRLNAERLAVLASIPGEAPADLLVQRRDDRFRFSHQSFYHFFLADAWIADLALARPGVISLGPLSSETIFFISLLDQRIDWRTLIKIARQSQTRSRWIMINALRIALATKSSALGELLPHALRSKNVETVRVALKCAGYGPRLPRKLQNAVASCVRSTKGELTYSAIETIGLQKIQSALNAVLNGIASPDLDTARISLWALRKLRSPSALPTAIALIDSKDARARRTGAEIIGMRQHTAAEGVLRTRLNRSPNPDDRYFFGETCAAISDRKKWKWHKLRRELLADRSRRHQILLDQGTPTWIKRYIIEEIGEKRIVEDGPVLQKLYAKSDIYLRNSIVDALGEMRDGENVPFLHDKYRTEGSPRIKANIVWALGNTSDPRSLKVLLNAQQATSPEIRDWARWAKAQYGQDRYDLSSPHYYKYPLALS